MQVILRLDAGEKPGEFALGPGEVPHAERETAPVERQGVATVTPAVRAGDVFRRVELRRCRAPFLPPHRHPREQLPGEDFVLQETSRVHVVQHRLERGPRGLEVFSHAEHPCPIPSCDPGSGLLTQRVVQRRSPLEVLHRGRQIVQPYGQRSEPAVGEGEALPVPGDLRFRQHLLQCALRLAESAAELELVASA